MPTYEVVIEETLSGSFLLDAPDAEEAAEVARRSYRAGGLMLEPGELLGARLCVMGEDGTCGPWEDV